MSGKQEWKPEIRGLLRSRDDFIGQVFRLHHDLRCEPHDIAEAVGHKNPTFSTIFIRTINLLLGEQPVEAKHYKSRQQALYRINEWLDGRDISNPLRQHLSSLRTQLLAVEASYQAKGASGSTAVASKPKAVGKKKPKATSADSGVYVYSYPMYLGGVATGDTLFKIGASESGVEQRLDRQRRHTEVPEDLVVLRVFPCADPFQHETHFHQTLRQAGKHHASKSGGKEWFMTTLAEIDAIAIRLELDNIAPTLKQFPSTAWTGKKQKFSLLRILFGR